MSMIFPWVSHRISGAKVDAISKKRMAQKIPKKNCGVQKSWVFSVIVVSSRFRYRFSIVLPCHLPYVPKKNKETHGEGRLNREPPLRCKELRAVFKVMPLALTPSNIIPSNLRFDSRTQDVEGGDESVLGVS